MTRFVININILFCVGTTLILQSRLHTQNPWIVTLYDILLAHDKTNCSEMIFFSLALFTFRLAKRRRNVYDISVEKTDNKLKRGFFNN